MRLKKTIEHIEHIEYFYRTYLYLEMGKMIKMKMHWRYIFIYTLILPNEDIIFRSNLETKTFQLPNIFEFYLTLHNAEPICY